MWGAPRIHGELLKLGFEIAESTVSKYMIRRRGPPSQTWRTFLRNHAEAIAAIDLCVVPTLTFECLFAFLVLGHGRRQLLWFAVTRHPTAEWLAQQILEAFPWNAAPTYLVRDNDRSYGQAFTRRLRTMGIRDRPISPRSPWQNAYVERLIGLLRRECLDHVLIFGEWYLRRILALYSSYYNQTRTHLALRKDVPLRRAVQGSGTIVATPILFGLHHRYARISMMAWEQTTPFNGPNTDARDQSSPDRHIRLAPHGRSIQNTWSNIEGRRRRPGGRFCATMPRRSRRLICAWFQP